MIIYGLTSSDRPGVIRYVGKTVLPLTTRVAAHISRALRQPKDTYKERWIRSALATGGQIEGVVLAFAVTDADAYRLEHHYIRFFKTLGFELTNGSDWGRGFQGYRHSEQAKACVAAAHRGRQRSPEELEKQRRAHLGKPVSAETRVKVATANRGRVHSEESRLKKSAALRGRQFTAAHRAKIAEANTRRGESQRVLAKAMAERNRGRTRSAESRAKQSAAWALKREQKIAAELVAAANAEAQTKVM